MPFEQKMHQKTNNRETNFTGQGKLRNSAPLARNNTWYCTYVQRVNEYLGWRIRGLGCYSFSHLLDLWTLVLFSIHLRHTLQTIMLYLAKASSKDCQRRHFNSFARILQNHWYLITAMLTGKLNDCREHSGRDSVLQKNPVALGFTISVLRTSSIIACKTFYIAILQVLDF